MSISNHIHNKNQFRDERGLVEGSYFQLFKKGKLIKDERTSNWSDFSSLQEVEYKGRKKAVMACDLDIDEIKVFHAGMSSSLKISDDEKVYQAIRSQTVFLPNGKNLVNVIGRRFGIIKYSRIIQEHFLNGITKEITGFKL